MDQEYKFKNMYLGSWPEPNEEDQYLHKLAIEYHERTEAYDRTICTGPIQHGMILPASDHEMKRINKNAFDIKRELQKRAMRECGIDQQRVTKAIQRKGQ